jgi:hypothetical protein
MPSVPVFAKGGRIVARAFVDEADHALVSEHKWFLDRQGYVWANRSRRVQGPRQVFMHRLVLGLQHGDGVQADHENRDKLDNRRSNLRMASVALNAQNRTHPGGASPHRGVTWSKAAGRWQAQVGLDGRTHYLGLFDDELAAARAASEFRRENMPFANEVTA